MEHNFSRLFMGYHFMFLLLGSVAVTFLGCGVSHEVHEDFRAPHMMYTHFQEQTGTEYILQSGDELEIAFFYNPELNTTAVVRPDGFISLQLIGDIKAGNDLTLAYCAEIGRQPRDGAGVVTSRWRFNRRGF
ncbi:MAG: polysaccharide biosynthesis/export family protein, partial [bacterium]